ncbi:TBC/Rab gtpase activating domain containing protein, partial [Entamoeba invadens IP1]
FVFAYKWIVLLFRRFIDDKYIFRIWDAVFAFPSSKFYYFIVVAIIKEYADDIIDNQMDFDDLFMLFQSLGNQIGDEIVFDADLLMQEFMHISQPNELSEFLKDDPIPK